MCVFVCGHIRQDVACSTSTQFHVNNEELEDRPIFVFIWSAGPEFQRETVVKDTKQRRLIKTGRADVCFANIYNILLM